MEDQQTRRINEAAQRFAEALTASYRAVTDRTVTAQQINAELTRNFFGGVIDNLRAQTKDNQEMIQELASQQQRQQEAARSLAQESTSAYMELLESMSFFYQRSVEEIDRSTREAGSSTGEVESSVGEVENDSREYFSNLIRETNRRSAGEA
jgi:predicted lactoylglutathione lyase